MAHFHLRQNVRARFEDDEQDADGHRQLSEFHAGCEQRASHHAADDVPAVVGDLLQPYIIGSRVVASVMKSNS